MAIAHAAKAGAGASTHCRRSAGVQHSSCKTAARAGDHPVHCNRLASRLFGIDGSLPLGSVSVLVGEVGHKHASSTVRMPGCSRPELGVELRALAIDFLVCGQATHGHRVLALPGSTPSSHDHLVLCPYGLEGARSRPAKTSSLLVDPCCLGSEMCRAGCACPSNSLWRFWQ